MPNKDLAILLLKDRCRSSTSLAMLESIRDESKTRLCQAKDEFDLFPHLFPLADIIDMFCDPNYNRTNIHGVYHASYKAIMQGMNHGAAIFIPVAHMQNIDAKAEKFFNDLLKLLTARGFDIAFYIGEKKNQRFNTMLDELGVSPAKRLYSDVFDPVMFEEAVNKFRAIPHSESKEVSPNLHFAYNPEFKTRDLHRVFPSRYDGVNLLVDVIIQLLACWLIYSLRNAKIKVNKRPKLTL